MEGGFMDNPWEAKRQAMTAEWPREEEISWFEDFTERLDTWVEKKREVKAYRSSHKREFVFGSVFMAPDGGLSEVKNLFRWPRYFSAALFTITTVLNVVLLLRQDLFSKRVTPRSEYFLHEKIIDAIIPGNRINPENLIAVFELCALALYATAFAFRIATILKPSVTTRSQASRKDIYKRWYAASEITQAILLELNAFSAMRMLQYVTPAILLPTLQYKIQAVRKERRRKELYQLIGFIASRLMFLFFGFEAFLVKFRIAAHELEGQKDSLFVLIRVAIFMHQMLGVVQVNLFARLRVFEFVFGGQDCYLSREERRRIRAWQAAFQWHAWQAYGHSIVKFLVVTLTFNHRDFQAIVIDEAP